MSIECHIFPFAAHPDERPLCEASGHSDRHCRRCRGCHSSDMFPLSVVTGEETAATSRRDRNKLRTRFRLQRAALELFATHGYDATTIAQITEAADVSLRTFFGISTRRMRCCSPAMRVSRRSFNYYATNHLMSTTSRPCEARLRPCCPSPAPRRSVLCSSSAHWSQHRLWKAETWRFSATFRTGSP